MQQLRPLALQPEAFGSWERYVVAQVHHASVSSHARSGRYTRWSPFFAVIIIIIIIINDGTGAVNNITELRVRQL